MADTKIEWTDATWNPVAGCTVMTAGCTNCYAMRMAARLDAMGTSKYRGLTRKSGDRYIWTGKVTFDFDALAIPRAWRKPRLIFVNSMSDLFQDSVPEEFITRVWATMAATPQHTYQVLTKRPDRMATITPRLPLLKNVWLGTSVENAAVLDRIDQLRAAASVVKFISFEPLLGSVAGADLSGIHWAIVGGESGPRARPMLEDWVNEIYDACGDAGTAFFFKQWGGRNKKASGRTFRGATFDEMPIYIS
jgi:protein gp37